MSALYLSNMLSGWPDLSKGAEQTSEVRGGKYAARVQEGYEKDGSPKYRYFKSQEEYDDYLKGKGGKKPKKKESKKKKGGDKELDEKRKAEQKESKKQRSLFTESAKKKTKNVETTKKSLRLYIEVGNE
jgi:hypothetical protein